MVTTTDVRRAIFMKKISNQQRKRKKYTTIEYEGGKTEDGDESEKNNNPIDDPNSCHKHLVASMELIIWMMSISQLDEHKFVHSLLQRYQCRQNQHL